MSAERQQLLANADAAARRGDFEAAAEFYRKLLTRSPNDLLVRQRLGDALARAGRSKDARAVFESLSESYREAGHPQRALAALRRAIYLDPDDPDLHERLAARLLERGLKGEAREALEAAAAAAARGGRTKALLRIRRELVRRFPDQPELLEALAEAADGAGDRGALWSARLKLAAARAAAGEQEPALDILAAAVGALPADAAADGEITDAVAALVEGGCRAAPARDDLAGSASIGWRLLRAEIALAAGQEGEARAIVGALAEAVDGWLPSLRLWAARLAAALGMEAVGGTLLDAGLDEAEATGAAATYRAAAASLLQRFPGLTETLPEGSALREAPAPPEGEEEGPGWLPAELEARIVEAHTMLDHGLTEQATEVVASLPAEWQRPGAHPRIDALRARIGETLGVVPRPVRPAPPETARPAPRPVGRAPVREESGEEEEEVIVLIEDETGETGGQPPAAEVTRTQPIERKALERAEPGSVDRLAIYLGEELPSGPEHDETRYQMAIGLLEMGLWGQAAELLAGCLDGGSRHWDAALELVRGHLKRGRAGEGLAVARDALDSGPRSSDPSRVEILLSATRLALEAGRREDGLRYLEELERVAPEHPGLELLRGLAAASES